MQQLDLTYYESCITQDDVINEAYNCGIDLNEPYEVKLPTHIVEIGDNAFQSTNLHRVYGLNKVQTIGKDAFSDTALNGKIFIDSCTSIGEGAFALCNSLTEVVLCDRLNHIPFACFHNCENLEKVYNLNKINSIGPEAFYGSLYGRIFIDSCDELGASAFEYSGITEVVLSSHLTEIPAQCFMNCEYLEKVCGLNKITYIGNSAFENTKLSNICIDSCETLGVSAFRNCKKLSKVVLNSNLYTIPETCFAGCGGMDVNETTYTQFYNLNKIRSIGDGAFMNSWLKDSIYIDSCKSIGKNAFSGCKDITKAIIVTSKIPISCFYECSKLEKIANLNKVGSIGMSAFKNCNLQGKLWIESCFDLQKQSFVGNENITHIVCNNKYVYQNIKDNTTEYADANVEWIPVNSEVVIIPDGSECLTIKAVGGPTNVIIKSKEFEVDEEGTYVHNIPTLTCMTADRGYFNPILPSDKFIYDDINGKHIISELIYLNEGDILEIRGHNESFRGISFHSTIGGQWDLGGNIMSLLDSDNIIMNVPERCFNDTFAHDNDTAIPRYPVDEFGNEIYEYDNEGNIIYYDVSKKMKLYYLDYLDKYVEETYYNYNEEDIPSTALYNIDDINNDISNYRSNFVYSGFESLVMQKDADILTAPLLPATSVGDYGYTGLFYNCKALKVAPELPATELGVHCYDYMLSGTGIEVAPELPATELSIGCYKGMFDGCLSLHTPMEELPATTIPAEAYFKMFSNTSITKIPVIKAREILVTTYDKGGANMYEMFSYCDKLTHTTTSDDGEDIATINCTVVPTYSIDNDTIKQEGCFQSMFGACSELQEGITLNCNNITAAIDSMSSQIDSMSSHLHNMYYKSVNVKNIYYPQLDASIVETHKVCGTGTPGVQTPYECTVHCQDVYYTYGSYTD